MEQDGVALARILDVLTPERLDDVVDGDDVVDRQPVPAPLQREDIEQNPAREERLDVLDAEVLEAVRRADVLLRLAVVVPDLAVARRHPDVAETVELRARLPDLT